MTFEFPSDLEQLINQQIGTGKFQSPEEVLRAALQEFADQTDGDTIDGVGDRHENALELLQKQGLVGTIRSGLGDLSTNPKHMEGFGRNGS